MSQALEGIRVIGMTESFEFEGNGPRLFWAAGADRDD